MLQLQPYLDTWKKQSFEIVMVTSDSSDVIQAFLDQNKVNARVLLDTEGKVGNQYGVQYIPTDFLINEKGVIEKNIVGWNSTQSMKELKDWIAKPPVN